MFYLTEFVFVFNYINWKRHDSGLRNFFTSNSRLGIRSTRNREKSCHGKRDIDVSCGLFNVIFYGIHLRHWILVHSAQ